MKVGRVGRDPLGEVGCQVLHCQIPRRARAFEEQVSISVVTLSELLEGAELGESGVAARRRAFVEQFLIAVEAIPVDEAVARVHARLWAELARAGQSLGVHDSWLAATALTHGLGILTRDAAFGRVAGLRVVTP